MPPKNIQKKITKVRQHARKAPPSPKNPSGITIVDAHLRQVPVASLNATEMATVLKNYDRTKLQDPNGEAKDFIFKDIKQSDLRNPEISIPMAIRWLYKKKAMAASKLKRAPSNEEIILEYKGLLKSMKNLRVSKIFFVISLFFNLRCTTSSFRISNQWNSANEFSVTPDRILLECEKLDRDDRVNAEGFMIHVLDDKSHVLTMAQGNALSPEICKENLKNIGQILKSGDLIYIAGIGDLDGMDRLTQVKYNFLKLGIFRGSETSLQFIAIANEQGACYSAYHGKQKPCPPPPFPLPK